MSLVLNPKVYKLKSGRYQISYYNPVSRKRMRRKFRLFADAQSFESNLHEQFFVNSSSSSSADSVEVWMKRYLHLNPTSFITRLGQPLNDSFLKRFGAMSAMSVTQVELTRWLEGFQRARDLSVRTMPNIKSAVSQFFQFIVDSKALAVNPMLEIKKIAGVAPKARTILTEAEIAELLIEIKRVSPDLIYPMLFMLAHTGARLGEIQNLKWKDVHFELGAIQLLCTKNGEDRLVQVSDEVIAFLERLPRVDENVMISFYGRAWTRGQYRKQFNKYRQKIAFKKYWCNHVLRHSYATNYLRRGGDMLQLQKIMGHKTLKMTVDLYGRIEAKEVQDVSPFNF